jgi:hypothetical protein
MVYMSGVVPGFGSVSSSGEGMAPIVHVIPRDMSHSMPMTAHVSGSGGVDLALAGAAILIGLSAFAFINLAQLAASADHSSAQPDEPVWPRRLTLCCQFAMGATMAHMIAAMV